MSKDFWFPWYPALYKADTRHLTAEQDGIYRRLIDEYMETREPLPDNDIALARIAGVSEIKWLDAARILRAYFTHADGMLFHKKCDQELDIQDKRSKKRTLSAEKAAKIRWSKSEIKQEVICDTHAERNAIAMRGDATVTVTDTIKKKNKQKKEKKNGTRVDTWECSTELGEWAEAQGLSVKEVLDEIEGFIDFWKGVSGKDGIKLDWDATFRNRIRSYLKRRK